MADYTAQIESIYLAYYGRPADVTGLAYWNTALNTAKGDLASIINSFGTSAEATSLYSSSSNIAKINAIYVALFNRSADAEGLIYYAGLLDNGTKSQASIALDILNGATGDDLTLITKKLVVSADFTAAMQNDATAMIAYAGTTAATTARSMLSAVTATSDDSGVVSTTLTTIETVTTDTTTAAAQTFTLTTGTNKFTGDSGDDTFDGGISSSSLQTLNSGDSLDGGAGDDTLYAVITGSVTPTALANIENVSVTNTTTAATMDFSNATGLSAITNQASTVGLTMSGISASGPTVTVRDTAIAGQVVTFNDVTGSADSATVVINNVASGATLTVAGVETLTLQSDGSTANVITTLTTAAATKLNVTGSIGLNAGTLGSTITTLDASANTGTGVTAVMGATTANTITGSAGNDSLTIVSTAADSIGAGAGNDTVWYSTGTWTTADTLNGGDGTDTVRMLAASAAGVATPTTYATTNIETVQITDALAAATYTPANISAAATTLNVTGNTSNAGATITTGAALSVTNAVIAGPAGSFGVGLGASLAANTAGILVAAGTLTINDTGTAITDSLTITNNAMVTSGAMLNVYNGANLVVGGYETVTIGTGSTSGVANTFATITVTGDAGGTSAETVKFTGSNILTMTGIISADIIDASGLTATGTAAAPTLTMITGSTATSITGSAGIDLLLGNTSSASSIVAGAGADTVTGGSGNDTILGGAGNDQITAGAGNDSIDAGEGNDTIIMAANLASGDVINGGDGTDTITASAAIAAAAAATISNVEIIGFSATAAQDMTAFLNAGITTLQTTGGNLTVTNAQTSLNTLIVGATTGTHSLTRLVDGTSDSLSLLLVDGTAATTLTTPSLANEETLTVGESGTDSTAAVAFALGTVTATSLTKLVITGSNNHSMTTSTGTTSLATVDASAATGTLSILGGTSAVNMTVTGPTATAMTITGGSGNDSVTAGAAADSLTGGSGNDTIIGGAGDDTIVAGVGVDSLVGGDGSDTLQVGTLGTTDGGSTVSTGSVVNISSSAVLSSTVGTYMGFLTATATAVPNADITSIAAGTMINVGTSATVSTRVDTISGFENVTGSTLKDYIVGSSSANTITGGTGGDVMTGGAGADRFVQGVADSVIGVGVVTNGASSTLIDSLDTFTFAGTGVDLITDFTSSDFIDVATAGTTYIDLSGWTAATVLAAGSHYYVQGTYVIGTGVFTVNTAATSATANYATMVIEGTGVTAADSVTSIILMGVVATDLTSANFV